MQMLVYRHSHYPEIINPVKLMFYVDIHCKYICIHK